MAKILLVEDDKSLREIYGVRLMAEGYEIVSAGDGEEALAMAIKERPDLIVSDVMMPKISGFDMLDILRSTTETKNVKVIMMTALSSEDQRARGEALGADRYLVKSQVGIEDVVRTVHDVLADGVVAPAAPVFPPVLAATPVSAEPAFAPAAAPVFATPFEVPSTPPVAQAAPVYAEPAPFAAPAPVAPVFQPAPAPVQAPSPFETPLAAPAFAPTPAAAPVFATPFEVPSTPPVAQAAPVYAQPAPAPAVAFQPTPAPVPVPVPVPAPAPIPQPAAPASAAAVGERVIAPLSDFSAPANGMFDLSSQIEQALNGSSAPTTPPTV